MNVATQNCPVPRRLVRRDLRIRNQKRSKPVGCARIPSLAWAKAQRIGEV